MCVVRRPKVSGWGHSVLACLEVAGDLPLEEEGQGYVFGSTRSHTWFWFSFLSPLQRPVQPPGPGCWLRLAGTTLGLIQSVLRQEGPVSRGSICPLPVQQDGLQEGTGSPRWKSAAICREGSFRSYLAAPSDRGAACEVKTVPQELAALHFKCKLIQTCS